MFGYTRSMFGFIHLLFRRPPHKYTASEIEYMSTADLQILHSSDRYREDPELLVMVWSELALREKDLQMLGEPTIDVRQDRQERDPATNAGSPID